jgi:hypothetical protein
VTRTDWTREEIATLFDLPFTDFLFRAAGHTTPVHDDIHRLREAEVQRIYGPGSNVVEYAADRLRPLRHTMPLAGEQVEALA